MLWYIIFSAVLLTALAEEFGITRRPIAAQTYQQSQPPDQSILPYVVRMIAFDSSGQSFGTGSYVGTYGEYGVILTNWHVVCESKGLVHVHFPSGFSSFGALIKSDIKGDLALIAISRPPQSIPSLTVSQTPSKPGDPLWIVGFGSGSYRIAKGQCVRYLARDNPTDGNDPLYYIMEVSVSARKGDSGGPILNQKGELAGVLFGSDMIRNTAGSYCERVNRFLMEAHSEMNRLPERPETHFATIEKNGPIRSLQESRHAVPQNVEVPQRSDVSGSSEASFGVRSSPRRYVFPVSNERSRIQLQAPPRGQEPPAMITMPLMSFTPTQRLEPANVVQTVPLEPVSLPVIPAADQHVADRYRVKLAADQEDALFLMFMSFNVFCAAGLTFFAVRLLRA